MDFGFVDKDLQFVAATITTLLDSNIDLLMQGHLVRMRVFAISFMSQVEAEVEFCGIRPRSYPNDAVALTTRFVG